MKCCYGNMNSCNVIGNSNSSCIALCSHRAHQMSQLYFGWPNSTNTYNSVGHYKPNQNYYRYELQQIPGTSKLCYYFENLLINSSFVERI